MTPARATRRARLDGFSLLELMIALAVGSIAITSIYSIGAASTRTFQQQQQLSNTQTSLRMAMDQVKRDFARAGYLSTPNVAGVGQNCGAIDGTLDQPPNSRLAAISAYKNDNAAVFDAGTFNRLHNFMADDVVLFANYSTADEYPGIRVVGGTQIVLDPLWQAYNRDFTTWYKDGTNKRDDAALADAFVVGRLVRVQTTRRTRHYSKVASAPVGDAFTIEKAPPAGCDANGGWVAPVSAIRYYARKATAVNEQERFSNATESVYQLIREEVQPDDKVTPLAGGSPARAVLDYLVRFRLSFTMTNRPGLNPGIVPTTADYQAGFVNVANTVNANPEWIRSVRIELGARAAQADANMPWSGSCDELAGRPLCFQLSDKNPNAARVRVLQAEVLVPNVSYEDL